MIILIILDLKMIEIDILCKLFDFKNKRNLYEIFVNGKKEKNVLEYDHLVILDLKMIEIGYFM